MKLAKYKRYLERGSRNDLFREYGPHPTAMGIMLRHGATERLRRWRAFNHLIAELPTIDPALFAYPMRLLEFAQFLSGAPVASSSKENA